MGANDVQFNIIGRDQASAALRQVASSASGATAQLTAMGSAGSSVNSVFRSAAGFAAGIATYQALSAAISSTVGASFGFAKSMETNQLGMAGILTSMGEIDGRTVSWGEALAVSKDIMGKLNDEALRTAATSEELVNAYRALLGPGLAAKMNMDQILQLTVTGTNAVKSLGLNNTQVVQELRDLVAGGIQPASSTLATSLGLTDKDITAAKQSSEGLFNFLMARLKGFEISSLQQTDTWQARIDQISEGLSRIGAEGLSPIFDTAKFALRGIGDSLVTVNRETGRMQVNPMFVSTLKTSSQAIVDMASSARQAAGIIADIAEPSVSVAFDGLNTSIGFVKENYVGLGTAAGLTYLTINSGSAITGAIWGLQSLGRGLALVTAGFGLATTASLAFLATPVGLAAGVFAGVGYAAWQFGESVQRATDDAESGTQRFLDGSVIMADGSTVAFGKVATAAEESASRVVSASKDAYNAMFALIAQSQLDEKNGIGIAGGKASAGWKAIPDYVPIITGKPTLPGTEGGSKGRSGGGREKTPDDIAREELQIWKARVEAGEAGSAEYLAMLKQFASSPVLSELSRLQFKGEYKGIEDRQAKEAADKSQAYHEMLLSMKLQADKEYTNESRQLLINQSVAAAMAYGAQSVEYLRMIQQLDRFDEQRAAQQQQRTDKALDAEQRVMDERLRLEQRLVDKNNQTMTDLITGQKSGTDILKQQWSEFISYAISQTLRLNSEMNVFKLMFGGLLGGGTAPAGNTSSFQYPVSTPTLVDRPVSAFARGGIANGWSVVGEEGIELVNFTQPGRVYTADQTRQALSGGGNSNNARSYSGPPVVMNVYAKDVQSFKKSQGQVLGDLGRAIRKAGRHM